MKAETGRTEEGWFRLSLRRYVCPPRIESARSRADRSFVRLTTCLIAVDEADLVGVHRAFEYLSRVENAVRIHRPLDRLHQFHRRRRDRQIEERRLGVTDPVFS